MKIEVGKKYVLRNKELIRLTATDGEYFFGFLITDEHLKGIARAFHSDGMSTYSCDWSIVKEYKEIFRDEIETICYTNPNHKKSHDGLPFLFPLSCERANEWIKVKAKIVLEEIDNE